MRRDIQICMAAGLKYGPETRLSVESLEALMQKSLVDDLFMSVYARWYRCGFPRIVLSHKHAASLMCTNIDPEIIQEVRAPWNAFVVDIPTGLLPWSAPGPFEGIFAASAIVALDSSGAYGVINPNDERGLFKYLIGDNENVATLLNYGDEEHKIETLVSRLVVGAAMEATRLRPSDRRPLTLSEPCRNHRGEPITNTFEIRRDVHVDCRQVVQRFLAGEREAPSVQTLVRGHLKRQPYGPKMSQRRVVFIEPYWRGPEDAPIAVRSHVIVE